MVNRVQEGINSIISLGLCFYYFNLTNNNNFFFFREAIKCGSIIRLYHSGTGRYLHSHYHQSPISHQQEVSAFDGLDKGKLYLFIKKIKFTHIKIIFFFFFFFRRG
jgi:hypothetical protein